MLCYDSFFTVVLYLYLMNLFDALIESFCNSLVINATSGREESQAQMFSNKTISICTDEKVPSHSAHYYTWTFVWYVLVQTSLKVNVCEIVCHQRLKPINFVNVHGAVRNCCVNFRTESCQQKLSTCLFRIYNQLQPSRINRCNRLYWIFCNEDKMSTKSSKGSIFHQDIIH